MLERAAGARLSGVLLLPAGFAVIVVVAQLLTMADFSRAGNACRRGACRAGIALSPPWRDRQLDTWALASAVAVFAIFATPVVGSGYPLGVFLPLGVGHSLVGQVWRGFSSRTWRCSPSCLRWRSMRSLRH